MAKIVRNLAILGILLVIAYIVVAYVDFRINLRSVPDVSLSDMLEAGYYIYILPENEQNELNLQRKISMHSLDIHCRGTGAEPIHNPIRIFYETHEGKHYLSINLSPYNRVLNRLQPATQVKLEAEWVKDNVGKFYEPISTVLVQDELEIEIRVSGRMDIEELTAIVNKLEYFGSENIDSNPWDNICK